MSLLFCFQGIGSFYFFYFFELFLGGEALFLQISYLYILKERRRSWITVSLPFAMIFFSSFFPLEFILKNGLFPLAGSFAVFFLYLAKTKEDHFLAFLLYIINGLLLCLLNNNLKAACDLLCVNLFVMVSLAALTFFFRIKAHNLEVSRFPAEFFQLIFTGKDRFFVFIYFALVARLLEIYPHEEWMSLAPLSFFFQVGFINLIFFIFSEKK